MAINSVGHSTSFIAQLQKSAGVSNQNNKVQKTLNATAGTQEKNGNTLEKAAEVQQQANTATVKKTVNKYA